MHHDLIEGQVQEVHVLIGGQICRRGLRGNVSFVDPGDTFYPWPQELEFAGSSMKKASDKSFSKETPIKQEAVVQMGIGYMDLSLFEDQAAVSVAESMDAFDPGEYPRHGKDDTFNASDLHKIKHKHWAPFSHFASKNAYIAWQEMGFPSLKSVKRGSSDGFRYVLLDMAKLKANLKKQELRLKRAAKNAG